MGTNLSMAERLLAEGQHLRKSGLYPKAIKTLKTVVHFDLPASLAVEAHCALAEAYEATGRFFKARRHLHIALTLAPRTAELHYRLAVLWETDETDGDLQRAARHYAKALKLDPEDAVYCRDFGLCLVTLGKNRTGLARLRQAYDLDPDDLDTLRALALHLVDMDRDLEARRVLAAAAFRHKGSPAYQQVHRLVGFAMARRQQDASRQAVRLTSHEPPKILPFLAPVRPAADRLPRGTILRLDGPQTSSPHVPRPARYRNHQTN